VQGEHGVRVGLDVLPVRVVRELVRGDVREDLRLAFPRVADALPSCSGENGGGTNSGGTKLKAL